MSSLMALKLAWQNVMPLTGLGTMSMTRRSSLALAMMRAMPRSGLIGGSSGWSAILTLNFSATGITALRKYSQFCHIFSSLTSPYWVSPCALAAAGSNSLVRAPPRSWTTGLVRSSPARP